MHAKGKVNGGGGVDKEGTEGCVSLWARDESFGRGRGRHPYTFGMSRTAGAATARGGRPTTSVPRRVPSDQSSSLPSLSTHARELKVPHFHHELVKWGMRIAMEEDGGRCSACAASSSSPPPSSSSCSLDAMAALFVFLANNSIVSEYQVAKGVDRLRRAMEDVRLDVPAAPGMLDEFESMASSILLK